jgi:hypothetical protein
MMSLRATAGRVAPCSSGRTLAPHASAGVETEGAKQSPVTYKQLFGGAWGLLWVVSIRRKNTAYSTTLAMTIFWEGTLLTTVEKIIFILLAFTSAGFTFHGFKTIIDSIRKGRPAPELKNIPGSLVKAAITVLFQQTIFKSRKVLSAIHMGLFFGLITYAFVNLVDVLEGLVPGFDLVYGGKHLPNAPTGLINAFNLIADVMSGFLLISHHHVLVRRFIVKDKALTYRDNVLLNPKVKAGGQAKDSLIVGVFVIMHVGARLMSQAFRLTEGADPVHAHRKFSQFSIFGASETGVHVAWWISLGWVMFIIPYLSRSKHTHFFMSPVNLGLPNRIRAVNSTPRFRSKSSKVKSSTLARNTSTTSPGLA